MEELKDERTHTELIIQHKENVQAELEALKHEVSRVDKELAELRGLENQAQETLKGLKEKETKARSELLALQEECKQGETEAEGLRNTRAQCEQLKRMLATQNFQYNEKAQQLLEMESTGTKLLAELEKMQARADTARDQYVRLERRVLRYVWACFIIMHAAWLATGCAGSRKSVPLMHVYAQAQAFL